MPARTNPISRDSSTDYTTVEGEVSAAPGHRLWLVVLATLLLLVGSTVAVRGAEELDIAGYRDFSYGSEVYEHPTGEVNESKLWWHDERWWAVLYNSAAGAYHIYMLDPSTQEWQDTNVMVDDRLDARSDVLWDADGRKLYVASHLKMDNPTPPPQAEQWARLYRYSYNASNRRYRLDDGYPVTINQDKTESLVLDKDSQGRLWITYFSRASSQDTTYRVYVNASSGSDQQWGTAFTLPFSEATGNVDDISSLIAFEDEEGAKIGVMWSNQIDGKFYFATHEDGAGRTAGWTLEEPGLNVGYPADDHINLAKTPEGQVLAAVKTESTTEGDVLIGVVARDREGSFSFHAASPVGSLDTNPIILVHEDLRRAYLFMSSKTGGGQICVSGAPIVSPLSEMAFPYENCPTPASSARSPQVGPLFFIGSTKYPNMNFPTSTKQSLTVRSGIVVMASDEMNERVYVHNFLPTLLEQSQYLPAVQR